MNRLRIGIMVLLGAALAVMFTFPPYFGVDTTSDGRVHGSLGYHPAWRAPSQDRAYAILLEEGILPDSGVQASDLAIRKNVVRLTLNVISLIILSLIGVVLLRSRNGARGSGEEPVAKGR